jgi:hypothetical protein
MNVPWVILDSFFAASGFALMAKYIKCDNTLAAVLYGGVGILNLFMGAIAMLGLK